MGPTKKPLILEIRGNSLDDGPGIRSVVFFKGCPLACVWCQNPEGKSTQAEIAFDAGECVRCDACLKVCSPKALSRQNVHFIDRTRCTLCFDCTDVCPSGALERVGRQISPDEIIDMVMKDKPFFDTSQGGVTLSGGEPTLFTDFAGELLSGLKRQNIHTLIETCGHFDMEDFRLRLLPYLNMIYFDLKLMDDGLHRRYTGVGNKRILDNFKELASLTRGTRVTLLPRVPLIPGITDTEDNLQAIASFLVQTGMRKAMLMNYNPLWKAKTVKLGIDETEAQQKGLTKWMNTHRLSQCREVFISAGIEL
jgi:pyruvate formate lyase activating enzyme